MSDKDDKQSIWNKVQEAGHAFLESQINKAKVDVTKESLEEDYLYAKSVIDEPSYAINSQGYKEKPHRIINTHLKQMALKDSVIAAIVQTRQNQVSNHSKLVKSEQERGFMIVLKDEETFLRKIKEQLEEEVRTKEEAKQNTNDIENDSNDDELPQDDAPGFNKAGSMPTEVVSDGENESGGIQTDSDTDGSKDNDSKDDDSKDDDEVEGVNWELERKAREKLEEEIRDRRKRVEDFILNAGELDKRPFETLKWNFDSCLRAWTRDSLTYDWVATEVIPNKMNKPHHFFPIDAATIKYASPSLKKYKMFPGSQTNVDLLYPEKQIEALEEGDALELNEELLEAEKYKYVQVIRGRIERAYTEDEMKTGMRNITTDIYNNGYGVAELELLVSLVSSHLNTEYYNQSYFTQGFSAKGILHLKAPIPRRKLETIRQQWHHMIRGTRNSFQTPIFAGMDEINWIPLTQNHSDIEFSGWMNYLIKMICSIYQIDPYEVGIGMKDEGSSGISGDNTSEKVDLSKDKGLYPLLRFTENYINGNIIDMIDPDFCLKFTGMNEESRKSALERQEKMSKFALTVNEIRQELGKPPLPGMDDIILSQDYMSWYDKYSVKGAALTKEQNQMNAMGAPEQSGEEDPDAPPTDEELDEMLNQPSQEDPDAQPTDDDEDGSHIPPTDEELDTMLDQPSQKEPEGGILKSLKIEFYGQSKDD